MTVRIHLTERLIHECARAAGTARIVGSFIGAACLVVAIVALVTSLH